MKACTGLNGVILSGLFLVIAFLLLASVPSTLGRRYWHSQNRPCGTVECGGPDDIKCCSGSGCLRPKMRGAWGRCTKEYLPLSSNENQCVEVENAECGGSAGIKCCPGYVCMVDDKRGAWGRCRNKRFPISTSSGAQENETCARLNFECGGRADIKCCHPYKCRARNSKFRFSKGTCTAFRLMRY